MSLLLLSLFLLLPPIPLRVTAGDERRRFLVREKDSIFGPLFCEFSGAGDRNQSPAMFLRDRGNGPLCRRPPPRRPWPEWPVKAGEPPPSSVRPGRNQEKRRKRKEEKKKKKKRERRKKKRKRKGKKKKKKKKKRKRKEKKRKEK